jgi:hypothetical protein
VPIVARLYFKERKSARRKAQDKHARRKDQEQRRKDQEQNKTPAQ